MRNKKEEIKPIDVPYKINVGKLQSHRGNMVTVTNKHSLMRALIKIEADTASADTVTITFLPTGKTVTAIQSKMRNKIRSMIDDSWDSNVSIEQLLERL